MTLIIGIDFLEHFHKREIMRVLDTLFTSLKPGGTLILQCPNGGSPFAGRLLFGDFTHQFAFTVTSAKQVLEEAGFRDVSVFGTDPFIHGFPSLIRVLVWRVIKTLLWVYLVAETGTTRGHVLTQNLIIVAQKGFP